MSENKHYQGHRERLRLKLQKNPDTLQDYEVLELLLGKVLLRKDTKPLAKTLMQRFQSIKGVLDAKPAELCSIADFGPAMQSFWVLLREVLARYAESPVRQRELLSSPTAVAEMARSRLAGRDHEEIWIAYVDTQNRLISWEQSSKGTVDNAVVYPRDVLERAIMLRASAFVLVHNHPGGSPSPSGADLQITEYMKTSARTIGLRLLDHIIVTDDGYCSVLNDGFI